METTSNWQSVTDRPAEDFDRHYIGLTCSECGEYYEIAYHPRDILFWEDDELYLTSHTTPPAERPADETGGTGLDAGEINEQLDEFHTNSE